jgi:hypothetical protein
MERVEPTSLNTLRSDIAYLYAANTTEAGHLRASHLAAVARLTPQTSDAVRAAGSHAVQDFWVSPNV